MTIAANTNAFGLGDRIVNRMGYGAMQLADPLRPERQRPHSPEPIAQQSFRACPSIYA
jgi:hypothetical protein